MEATREDTATGIAHDHRGIDLVTALGEENLMIIEAPVVTTMIGVTDAAAGAAEVVIEAENVRSTIEVDRLLLL